MKKVFTYVLLLVFALSLIGCDRENPPIPPVLTDDEKFWDQDENGIPDWQEQEITLTYATWQYNNPDSVTIDTLMIQAFMDKYPNITVNMQIVAEDAVWDEAFLALLETESLPDVFLVRRLENFLPYGILADITNYYNHDPDTDYIFDSVRDLGLYKDKRYVIPTYIYPQFWVVNLDILQSANIEIPGYDWTWEQMEAIAKAATNDTTKIIGTYGTAQYFTEYPKVLKYQQDPEVGIKWLSRSYDGNQFNYMDDVFLQAMNGLVKGMQEKYVVNQLGADTLLEYYGDANVDPRYAGYVALWREPSWSVKEHMNNFNFEWDVYPAPNGIGGGNTDIAGISAFCTNKAAAYQLLKWMSYSEEGITTRYNLYSQYSDQLFISGNNYPYPICDYGIDGNGINQIWDNIPYGSTAPGLVSPEFIEALRKAALQANKEVIGWDAVDSALWPYFNQIIMGENDYATLRESIQEAADLALKEKRDAIDRLLGN